jgi:hypothetical protein
LALRSIPGALPAADNAEDDSKLAGSPPSEDDRAKKALNLVAANASYYLSERNIFASPMKIGFDNGTFLIHF